MRKFLGTSSLLIILLLLLSELPAYSQRRRAPQLREDVELPADFTIDFQLGPTERSKIRGGRGIIVGTPLNEVGETVFHTLVDSPTISAFALPYRWSLTIIDSEAVNAHSLSDGEVSVDKGLAELLGFNRGLWAAALSHETEHTARRHAVRRYLYTDRKSTRLNSSHIQKSRMPSSA